MKDNDIPVNGFSTVDWNDPNLEVKEDREGLTVNGEQILKPFVEKPFNADEHDIHIYYGPRSGFGCTRLHRKTYDRCSKFVQEDTVRRDRGYIYEKFLKASGFDIKVYAIGTNYFHAEARKAPFLDGVVVRNKAGKEVRYPVLLTPEEKSIAQKIVTAFK